MDPITIASGTISIIASCGKLIEVVGRFAYESREAADSIAGFYDTIVHLQGSLQALGDVLQKRPRPLHFERDHYQNISRIVESCRGAVERLERQLPKLPTEPGSLAKARIALDMCIKTNTIQQTVSHISTYTQVLQLSLMTLSLGTLWGAERSQNQVEMKIRELTDSIRSANLVPSRAPLDSASDKDPALAEDDVALHRDVRAWMDTADEIAVAVSLHDYLPSDSGIDMGMESVKIDDSFDPEPEIEDTPSCDILQHQFDENQKLVQQLVGCGIFAKASDLQRKGIQLKKHLAKAHHVPFEFGERADMEEALADVLIDTMTIDGRVEAKKILQSLLQEEIGQVAKLRTEQRRTRLYHKLGRIAFDQNDAKTARKFLGRAFEGRRMICPMPTDLITESGDLLVMALEHHPPGSEPADRHPGHALRVAVGAAGKIEIHHQPDVAPHDHRQPFADHRVHLALVIEHAYRSQLFSYRMPQSPLGGIQPRQQRS